MKKNYFLKKCLLLTTVLVLIFAGSCKKGSKDPEPTPEVPVVKQITLDKTTALPGDLIKLTSTTPLDKDSWEIKVGSKTVAVGKYDNTTAYLTMPYLPAGVQTIDLTSMGITEMKSVTISAYTPVADADVEINKFKTSLTVSIAAANAPANAAYKDVLTGLQTTFNTEYAKLTADEKKELAFVYTRQMANIEAEKLKVAGTGAGLTVNGLKTFADGDDILTEGRVYVICVVAAAVSAKASYAAFMYIPNPWTKCAAALGSGVSFGLILAAGDAAEKIVVLAAKHVTIDDFTDKITGQSSGNLQVNGLKAVNAANPTFTFSMKQPAVTFKVTSTYNALSLVDKDNTGPAVKRVFDNSNDLKAAYELLAKGIEKVRNVIPILPSMPAYVYPIPATPKKTEKRYTAASSLTIENISNPKIKIAITGQGDNVTLRTTNEGVNTDLDFTFDLVYKNANMGVTVRKTITANYDGAVVFGKIAVVPGTDYQVADAGKKLPKPLQVKVTDIDGKAVAGHKVQWKITTTGGTLSAAESVTDTAGIARTEFTVGDGELQYVEARAFKADGVTLISGAPVLINAGVPSIYGSWEGYYFLQDGQELFSNTDYTRPGSEAYYTSFKINITNGLTFTMSSTYRWYDDSTHQTHIENESESGTVSWNKTTKQLEFKSTSGATIKLNVTTLTAAEMHLFKPDSSKTGYWRMDSLTDDGEVLKLKRKVN